MSDTWRNRIIGSGEEDPTQLLANPLNFRIHPRPQQDALSGVLSEVGWVQQVLINQQTGHVIDGHLRVELAISRCEPTVPVLYVDLTPAEEALILATLDPIGAMAAMDAPKLEELIREVQTGDAGLQAMLAELAAANGLDYGEAAQAEIPESRYQEQYGVIVVCESEAEQERAYDDLKGQGFTCRVVTT